MKHLDDLMTDETYLKEKNLLLLLESKQQDECD